MSSPSVTLANALDAIPIVASPTDRSLRFPAPSTNQRVFTLSTLSIDRWTGTAWVSDFISTSTTLPQIFGGLVAANAGLFVNDVSGYDYIVMNSGRLVGGNIGIAFYGQNPSTANDVYVRSDGTGNLLIFTGGVNTFTIDRAGNMFQVVQTAAFFSGLGGHQAVSFGITNLAASQTNLLLSRGLSTGETNFGTGPNGAIITGLTIRCGTQATAGSATATVFINGVASGMTVTLPANTFQVSTGPFTSVAGGALQITGGAYFDIRVTTTSNWNGTTGFVGAQAYVLT